MGKKILTFFSLVTRGLFCLVCQYVTISDPMFSAYLQHQHVEAPRIPKPGGSERPAAGSAALWDLWVYYGLNNPLFLLL